MTKISCRYKKILWEDILLKIYCRTFSGTAPYCKYIFCIHFFSFCALGGVVFLASGDDITCE